jgi:hypothetical protein
MELGCSKLVLGGSHFSRVQVRRCHTVALMNTNKRSKITVVVLIGIAVLGAVFMAPRFFTAQKIQAEVTTQLMRAVPHTRTWQGREERLQRVDMIDCQRSLQGDKYALRFELVYTGTLRTGSGCVLQRDEWGHYSGQWNTADFPPVRFYIQ